MSSRMNWAKAKAERQMREAGQCGTHLRGALSRVGPDCPSGHQTVERTVRATGKRYWCCTSRKPCKNRWTPID